MQTLTPPATRPFWHVLLLLLMGPGLPAAPAPGAATAAVPTPAAAAGLPDAEIADYVKRHGVLLWEVKPGARLQRDYEARWLRWCERVILPPLATRLGADAATRERALRVARQGILLHRQSALADPAFTTATLLAECEALDKTGVSDPLLLWLHGWAAYKQTQDTQACDALYKRGAQLPLFSQMPATTRLLIMSGFQQLKYELNQLHHKVAPKGADMVEAAWQSLQEGAYQPDEDDILDENILPAFHKPVMTGNEKRVQELSGLATLSEWARQMLAGHYHNRMAWNSRGNSFAGDVKPEGWQGFEEHYDLASKAFRRAWELRQDLPGPAYALLGLGLTGGDTGEKPEVWLQRVLGAQFDHYGAFKSVMNGLLPRWGGSHESMLACGLSCAATRRFDTRVPYYFFEALTDVANEAADWPEISRQPVIARTAIALCQQRVKDAPTPELRQEALMLLGAWGWICGDYEAAYEAFTQAPAPFPRSVVLQLVSIPDTNEMVMRGESAIFAIGYEDAWRAAEAALERKDLAAAEDGYQSIRAQMHGVAGGAELADSRLATVRLERALATGKWVPLSTGPTLAGWQVQKGEWTGGSDGRLSNRGLGTSAFIYNRARIESDFQIRGRFDPASSGMGVIIGFGRERGAEEEHWLTCLMRSSSVIILDKYSLCSLKNQKVPRLPRPSTFQITCHQGRVTFEVNDQEVYTEVVPTAYYDERLALPLFGHMGFCHSLIKKDDVTTILSCEVRLLPADFKRKP